MCLAPLAVAVCLLRRYIHPKFRWPGGGAPEGLHAYPRDVQTRIFCCMQHAIVRPTSMFPQPFFFFSPDGRLLLRTSRGRTPSHRAAVGLGCQRCRLARGPSRRNVAGCFGGTAAAGARIKRLAACCPGGLTRACARHEVNGRRWCSSRCLPRSRRLSSRGRRRGCSGDGCHRRRPSRSGASCRRRRRRRRRAVSECAW